MKLLIENAYRNISMALSLERKIVGIKFLLSEEEYVKAQSKDAKSKIPYCVMVKIATHGYGLKATLKTSGCGGGTRALGLEKPAENFYNGQEYNSFGLYENIDVSKVVADNITLCKQSVYGIETKPLEQFDENPDVIIIVADSYNAMRIIQGYTYKYGTKSSFKLAGNQAVCGECTSYPYENDTMNISMFCSGTRYLAGWKDYEICIGMSLTKFIEIVEGVQSSINGSETNERKDNIRNKMRKMSCETGNIKNDEAYFVKFKN